MPSKQCIEKMILQNSKFRLYIVFVLLSGLCCFPFSLRSNPDPVAMGDKYFLLMRYKDAVAWYEQSPGLAEAQWKIARSYVCYGDIMIGADREIPYRNAVIAARRCIALDENNGNGHTWLAAALGNIAIFEGSRSKVKLCNEVKKELTRAISLNPKDDVAYSILGTFYRVVGNISWFERKLAAAFLGQIPQGGFEDSEQSFFSAIRISPHLMRHWFELGLLYRDWDKDEKAKEAFIKAQKCPVQLASDKIRLREIAEYLK
jgi:tetratricopeptide (TPR) repeat protein